MTTSRSTSKRTALVIGSGGIMCAASIGLWRVLQRESIPIDMIVGCSGGSVFAATMAQGLAAEEIQALTERLWPAQLEKRFRYRSIVQALFPRLIAFSERFGLLDDRQVNAAFRAIYGEGAIQDTQTPLYLVATDLVSGEKVVLEEGPMADAVRASMAIPVLFSPWQVDGRLLIDGGTSDPLPISVAIREGAEIIIAMGFESPYVSPLASVGSMLHQTTSIVINHLLKSTYAFYNLAHYAEVVPVIPSFDRPIALGDIDQVPYLVAQGEAAAEVQLPYLRRLLAQTEMRSR